MFLKVFSKKVWIDLDKFGYFQDVSFDNLPHFCRHCQLYCHGGDHCFSLHLELQSKTNIVSQTAELLDPVDLKVSSNSQLDAIHTESCKPVVESLLSDVAVPIDSSIVDTIILDCHISPQNSIIPPLF